MDATEAIALEYLQLRGFKDPVYEPDGMVPPDFLVDGRIAVEVRRLNQHEMVHPRGLEETGIPFIEGFERLLESCSVAAEGTRWIHLSYQRPLPRWSTVESRVRDFLGGIARDELPIGARFSVSNEVEMEYIHLSPDLPGALSLGSMHDQDSGGFVISELKRNLDLVLAEKSRKTASYRCRYPEWWLVLVDTVAYGLSRRDRDDFLRCFDTAHDWDRIVLVSPVDVANYFEFA